MGFSLFSTFLGIVLAEDFGFRQKDIGSFFAYMGLMIILAQGILVRRLSGRFREISVLHFSMPLVSLSLLPYAFIPETFTLALWIFPPIIAAGMALTRSFGITLLTRISPVENRAEITGMHASAYALAQAIPSAFSGYIAASHARAPLLAASILGFAGWLVFYQRFKFRS